MLTLSLSAFCHDQRLCLGWQTTAQPHAFASVPLAAAGKIKPWNLRKSEKQWEQAGSYWCLLAQVCEQQQKEMLLLSNTAGLLEGPTLLECCLRGSFGMFFPQIPRCMYLEHVGDVIYLV